MTPRFKPVPAPPADREGLAAAQAALPVVPRDEDDCCRRLAERTALGLGRDQARTWLTFLRALGLAERTASGFRRTDRDPESTATTAAFRERVFGAREVLDALGDGPATVDDAAEAVAAATPAWERERRPDWRAEARERAANLCDWAVRFGLAERAADGYRLA